VCVWNWPLYLLLFIQKTPVLDDKLVERLFDFLTALYLPAYLVLYWPLCLLLLLNTPVLDVKLVERLFASGQHPSFIKQKSCLFEQPSPYEP
jgi:hypothetical protein